MDTFTLSTPKGNFIIRRIQSHEALQLRTLRLEALLDSPAAFGADYHQSAQQPDTHWEERARAGQGDGDVVIYVADHVGELVGMAGVYRPDNPKSRHHGTLWGVYVQPAWRGLGLGGKLSEACIDWARAKEMVMLKLGVITTNTAAIRCYERLGFRSYGVEPKSFFVEGKYYDLMRMYLELS